MNKSYLGNYYFLIIVSLIFSCTKKEVSKVISVSPKDEINVVKTDAQVLNEAQVDFEAVLQGKLPPNSVFDDRMPVLADGGTRHFYNNNYRLIIKKTIAKENGVSGFLYGPIIIFNKINENGKPKEIKNIKFYEGVALEKMLGHPIEKDASF